MFPVELASIQSKVNQVQNDCTMCNVCTQSVSYDLQTTSTKTTTKGRDDGGALLWYCILRSTLHGPHLVANMARLDDWIIYNKKTALMVPAGSSVTIILKY
eukprot:scpid90873/ scgid31288/ 